MKNLKPRVECILFSSPNMMREKLRNFVTCVFISKWCQCNFLDKQTTLGHNGILLEPLWMLSSQLL